LIATLLKKGKGEETMKYVILISFKWIWGFDGTLPG